MQRVYMVIDSIVWGKAESRKDIFCFFARAVVRCIVKHDTLGRRKLGSPSGDKNAA